MTTQYEKIKETHRNGMVTIDKDILRFCPSDLLEYGNDDCSGEKEETKCRECWNKKYSEVNE